MFACLIRGMPSLHGCAGFKEVMDPSGPPMQGSVWSLRLIKRNGVPRGACPRALPARVLAGKSGRRPPRAGLLATDAMYLRRKFQKRRSRSAP